MSVREPWNTFEEDELGPRRRAWTWTILSLLLVGLFAFIIWRFMQKEEVHFFPFADTRVEELEAPPIPFAAEDADRIRRHATTFELHEPQENFASLQDRIQAAAAQLDQDDSLIVYVNALGVAMPAEADKKESSQTEDTDHEKASPGTGGQETRNQQDREGGDDDRSGAGRIAPFLIGSQFGRAEKQRNYQELHSVEELLATVSGAPQGVKLIVLTGGQLGSDVRLGVVENEFIPRLAEAVRAVQDPDLWVLTSTDARGAAAVDYPAETSIFGRAFAEAIVATGENQRPGQKISLGDLWRTVRNASLRHELSSPLLMRGGRGVVDFTDGGLSTKFCKLGQRPQDAAEGEGEQSAGEQSKSKGEKDDGAQEEGGQVATEVQALIDQIDQVWQLRDQLQREIAASGDQYWSESPQAVKIWAPVDFAPQLWRELNARLVDLDRRIRSGAAYDRPRLRENLRDALSGLQLLKSEMESPNANRVEIVEGSVVTDLRRAWRQYLDDPDNVYQNWMQAEEDAAAQRNRRQLTTDLWYQAVELVRFYESTWHLRSEQDGRRIEDLLSELRRLLAAEGSSSLETARRAYSLIVREIIDADVQQALSDAATGTIRARTQQVIESLLNCSMPRASQRQKLRHALLTCELAQKVEEVSTAQLGTTELRLDGRVKRLLWLHAAVGQVADTAFSTTQPTRTPGDLTKLAVEGRLTTDRIRLAGAALRGFYEELPARIKQLPAEDQLPAHEAQRRLLPPRAVLACLLDARDVTAEITCFPHRSFTLPPPEPELSVLASESSGQTVKTQLHDPQNFTVELRAVGGQPVLQNVAFDAKLLSLRLVDHEELRGGGGKPVTLPLPDEGGIVKLQFQVTAKQDRQQAGADRAPIALEFQMGELLRRTEMTCELPLPNDFDVLVSRIGQVREQADDDGLLRLRPFPNRDTTFAFTLRNQSGQSHRVKAELYAAERPADAKWPPGRTPPDRWKRDGNGASVHEMMFDENGVPRRAVRPLMTTEPLVAPPRGAETPLEFKLASGPEPESNAAAAKTADKAKPEKGPDVSHGLVLVITRLEGESETGERWFKYINIDPLHPRDFLQPSVVYDSADQRVVVSFAPKDPDEVARADGEPVGDPQRCWPEDIRERGIQVVWRPRAGDGFTVNDAVNTHCSLGLTEPRPQLSCKAPADAKQRIVRLDVDQYPRAFIYRIVCEPDRQGEDLRPALNQIRLQAVSWPEQPWHFYMPFGMDPAQGDLLVQEGLSPAFRPRNSRSGEGDRVSIKLQADAQFTALQHSTFLAQQAGDSIAVSFDGQVREVLFADRDISMELVEPTSPGLVTIGTEVKDHQLDLLPGKPNGPIEIQAKMQIGDRVEIDRQEFIVDSLPPRFPAPLETARLKEGGLRATVHVQDPAGSGIKQVQFGIDGNNNDRLDDDELIKEFASAATSDNVWTLVIDTSKLEPGNYKLFARATDRVGFVTDSQPRSFAVVPPPKPTDQDKPKEKKPTKGVIKGQLKNRKQTSGFDGITVWIEGMDKSTKAADNGSFQFVDVPLGSYTLRGKGVISGYTKKFKLEKVEPTPPPDKPKVWQLPLDEEDDQ